MLSNQCVFITGKRAFLNYPFGVSLNDAVYALRANARSLDPLDCREPGRCAVVVVSRLDPVRFDGGDTPSIARVEHRSQLFLTDGCGPVSGPSSLKHNTYRVPPCSVTDARRAAYPGRSPPSKVWNSPQSSTVSKLRPKRSRWNASAAASSTSIHGRRPSPARSPVPSQPRQRPEPAIPARRREERSRRSRSPHRAPLRRIPLPMPNARLLAAAGRYPKAQGRRGTTHPGAVPSAVREWLAAGH